MKIKKGYGTKTSKEFCDRLCSFYFKNPTDIKNLSHIWLSIYENMQKSFHEILLHRDYNTLSEWLYRLYETEVVYGLDTPNSIINLQFNDPLHFKYDANALRNPNSVPWFVFLACCASGIVSLPNKDSDIPNILEKTNTYVKDFCDFFNINIGIKETMGMYYFDSNGVKILPRTCYFLPVYASINRLLPIGGSVLEIGSGTGKLAHLICQNKLITYHSCDLPIPSVILASFIEQQFGESEISFSGDTNSDKASIHIHGCSVPTNIKFDLVINQDSIPEMPKNVAKQYLYQIESQLNIGGYFLSINQEDTLQHNPILPMMNEFCPRMRLLYRSPCWNRPGYIEQCWAKFNNGETNDSN